MRSRFLALWLPCLLFITAFSAPGCARQPEAAPATVKAYHSGDLKIANKNKTAETIYIDVRGADAGALTGHLKKAMADTKYQIVDSPSKAGYILHVSLVREGVVNPEVFKNIVNAGYGADAGFSGQGASGIITDALLVQRRVPTAKRPSHAKLKNISARNALDNSQMRLGLITDKSFSGPAERSAIFAEPLARELQRAIAPKSMDTALAH